MSADLLRLVLLVLVPADWDAVPEGIAELRRCLMVGPAGHNARLAEAFVDLRWLDAKLEAG